MRDSDHPNRGLFQHLETVTVDGWGRPPLHERIQDLIDRLNPDTAPRREAWMADLRVSTPGDGGDGRACRITDFELTVDRDLETHDDLEDATRMFLESRREPELTAHQARPLTEEKSLSEMADEVEKHYDDPLEDEVYIHPSVFPGDARSLGEAEALVGTHPKHETLEELPGPCILCGEDEVYVTVRRDVDGEIVWSQLTCQDCGWEVSSDEEEPGFGDEVPRYCPRCGEDHVRVTVTFQEGEAVETQLQCSRCELGQQ